MEGIVVIFILWLVAGYFYACGKREGSRKGFGVGRWRRRG